VSASSAPKASFGAFSAPKASLGAGGIAFARGGGAGRSVGCMARPPSAVSALTAGAFTILCVVTVIAVVLRWVPAYVLLASAALAVGVVFNVWAARGSRD
jgi:hypothetical protein